MNHCLLLTVYKSAEICNRLIERMPENWDVYIHVDRKSDIKADSIHPRAKVFSEFKVFWGGREHLDAFLFLMETARANPSGDYDYYHLATGEDYWAYPPECIDGLLSPPHSYISIHKLPQKNWYHGGYELIQYKQLTSFFDIRKPVFSTLNRFVKWSQILLGIKRPLPPYPLYRGIVYNSLHRSAVDVVLKSEISKDFYQRLKNTLVPEELFFQTVLMNSSVKDSIINNPLRYMDWSSTPAPKFLDPSDLDTALAKKAIFCRKIKDEKLTFLIDQKLKNSCCDTF